MHILALISGEYGTRHVENIRARGPQDWTIESWDAPKFLPLVIDYPEDYLPEEMPPADLILALAELKGVAELVPEIAQMTGARSVIAPVDNEAWLPRGLARQLRGWLERQGVACVTPKPFCSLTDTHYDVTRREKVAYQDDYLGELLDTIRARMRQNDTLTIIAADHGDGLGDHGYFGHAFVAYEELVHVSLIVDWPRAWPVGQLVGQPSGEEGRVRCRADRSRAAHAGRTGSRRNSRAPACRRPRWLMVRSAR